MSKCTLTEPQKHALLQRFLAQWRRLPSRILCRTQITFGSYRIWQKVRSRSNSFHKIVFIGIVCTTVLRGASKQKWSVTYAYIRTFAYLQRWTSLSVTISLAHDTTSSRMVRRATQNCFVAWRRHVIAVHACQQSIRQRCDAKITLQKNLERLADISSNRWSKVKQH